MSQMQLFGRTFTVESHGRNRTKVYGSITNAEAEQLGLSRITAWKSRRDGFFWIGYHEREKSNTSRELNQEEIAELQECARIGATVALRAYGILNGRELRPFEFDDLVQEACEGLLRKTARPEYVERGWRIGVAKHAAMTLLRGHAFRGRSVARPEDLFGEVAGDSDDLERVEDNTMAAQIRAYVVLNHGFEAWDRIWSWACSTTEQPPAEVAAIIREVLK